MSQNHNREELNPAEPNKTPLQQVQEQQAMQQENDILERRPDTTAEVPGAGPPSDRRHHPQRQNR